MAIAAERTESVVTDEAIRRLTGPDRQSLIPTEEATGASAELMVDLQATLSELATRHGRGEISKRAWHAARTPLQAQAAALHASVGLVEYADVLSGLPHDHRALREEWHSYPLHRRRQIIAALIDHITIRPASRKGAPFDPSRVTDGIVWSDANWPAKKGR